MVVKRIKEVQHVVAGHQQHLATLDTTCSEHAAAIATVTVGLTGAMAASKAVEMRTEQKLRDSVKALDARVTKEASQVSANRSDISAIRAQLAGKR